MELIQVCDTFLEQELNLISQAYRYSSCCCSSCWDDALQKSLRHGRFSLTGLLFKLKRINYRRVGFLTWRHTFTMATMTSACRYLCSNARRGCPLAHRARDIIMYALQFLIHSTFVLLTIQYIIINSDCYLTVKFPSFTLAQPITPVLCRVHVCTLVG